MPQKRDRTTEPDIEECYWPLVMDLRPWAWNQIHHDTSAKPHRLGREGEV